LLFLTGNKGRCDQDRQGKTFFHGEDLDPFLYWLFNASGLVMESVSGFGRRRV
jgi:hypothetical protein